MPYTLDVNDPLQPLDTDQGLVLGGEVRKLKEYIGIIPQNSRSANYTLVRSDAGKEIFHPAADTTARTWTIPANATVAYPIGTVITFGCENGAGTVSIVIGGADVLRLLPTGATGSRTLPANSVATARKITATSWQISGTGLS